MPAGDVFGLDGFFLNVSNPVTVSAVDINSTATDAGIAVMSGVLDTTAGIATLTFDTAAGLSTTPFYIGAKIAVSGLSDTTGVAFTGYNGNFVVTGFAGTTTVSYATTGYVGGVDVGITTTGLVMLVTDTAVTNTTWSSDQTHGYYGGGANGAARTAIVQRTDFSNDTSAASLKGSLSLARHYLAATGNSNYGWFGGGFIPPGSPVVSTVDRIDFANDSSTASLRGSLSLARGGLAATGNSNFGWFGGGTTSGPAGGGGPASSKVTTVDRIDFSNDSSTASPRGPLSLSRYGLAATGNFNYGWFAGGVIPATPNSGITRVDRIDFSNDSTTASIRNPLTTLLIGTGMGAIANSNYGWFTGGGGIGYVGRIDFSNDSFALLGTLFPFTVKTNSIGAIGNSNYGWFGGGSGPTFPSTAAESKVSRLDFSNDYVDMSSRGFLSVPVYSMGTTSGKARSVSTRKQKTGSYGYFAYGLPSSVSTNINRIDFYNDTGTALVRGKTNLDPINGTPDISATGNSDYGWFAGDNSTTAVERMDFSNDSATAIFRAIPPRMTKATTTANSNYGWWGGGGPGGSPRTTVYRLNFFNDLEKILGRGSLISARTNAASTGNSNYGWFGGGGYTFGTQLSSLERIDFSNDSGTASPRGTLSFERYGLAATGNSNYGWFGGSDAAPFPGPLYSTVDRIDFSNDSATASVRGPLSAARSYIMATGNSNYGWFGGGYTTAGVTRVDRINFSNDSTSASVRGPLAETRYSGAVTSNTTR
jgi:hypothetical protein